MLGMVTMRRALQVVLAGAVLVAVVPGAAAASSPPADRVELSEKRLAMARAVQPHVQRAAKEHGIDPQLLNGIIWVESKFNPKAHNKKSGAKGLMQLMPGTSKAMAKRLGRRSRPFDPEFATQAGAKLLQVLSKKFDGDIELMLFAYARGGGAVRKWQGSGKPMPERVRRFIARVQNAQASFEAMGL